MDTHSVDLARLIALVAEEVMAARSRAGQRCACHSVDEDCCPNRLQPMIDAGAVRLGLRAPSGVPQSVAGLIDHTLLKPDATSAEIEQLCKEAAEFRFATVCVNPVWVALAASRLRGTSVSVCSVVGFPLGATTPDVKRFETCRAIFDGAREVDMVSTSARSSRVICARSSATSRSRGPVPRCRRDQQSDHRSGAAHRRKKGDGLHAAKAAGADFVNLRSSPRQPVAGVALMRRVVGGHGRQGAGGVRRLDD